MAVPDGESDIKPDTEWADSVDGEVRVESFIVSTAIPAVEGANRRDAAHRAIAGFSMGGYGSANLAEHHPDLFGQLVSISGYYHIDDLSGMGADSPAWTDAYSPDRHVASLAGTRTLLIVDSQESDPLIKGEGARFAALQRAAGQTPAFVVAPGTHSWTMVAGQVPTTSSTLAGRHRRGATPTPLGQPARSRTTTGICRVVFRSYSAKPGRSCFCFDQYRSRSSPSVTRAVTGKRSVPTSTEAGPPATRLWNQAGFVGAPA